MIFASAYTKKELEKGRACSRLALDFLSNGYVNVWNVKKLSPDLDHEKIAEKLTSDVFEQCFSNITPEEVHRIKTSIGKYSYKDYLHLFSFEPEKYKTEEDLTVSEEIKKLRKLVMKVDYT
jgi:hypothetical protein